RVMSATPAWQRSRLLAWVLMPDHWHGLVELGGFDSLPTCVGRLKGRSARLLRQAHPGIGPTVWAPAYHDRALRAEEQLVDAARYVVMNPVRAGLVRRVGDYPYWDAVWVSGGSRLNQRLQVRRRYRSRTAWIWASTAAMAVRLTMRREVGSDVRMCAGLSRSNRIGLKATRSVATQNML